MLSGKGKENFAGGGKGAKVREKKNVQVGKVKKSHEADVKAIKVGEGEDKVLLDKGKEIFMEVKKMHSSSTENVKLQSIVTIWLRQKVQTFSLQYLCQRQSICQDNWIPLLAWDNPVSTYGQRSRRLQCAAPCKTALASHSRS